MFPFGIGMPIGVSNRVPVCRWIRCGMLRGRNPTTRPGAPRLSTLTRHCQRAHRPTRRPWTCSGFEGRAGTGGGRSLSPGGLILRWIPCSKLTDPTASSCIQRRPRRQGNGSHHASCGFLSQRPHCQPMGSVYLYLWTRNTRAAGRLLPPAHQRAGTGFRVACRALQPQSSPGASVPSPSMRCERTGISGGNRTGAEGCPRWLQTAGRGGVATNQDR